MSRGSQIPPCAFFVEDAGGWWSFKGIHVDKEAVLKLLEKFKHAPHVARVVVLELPSGRVEYEWSKS